MKQLGTIFLAGVMVLFTTFAYANETKMKQDVSKAVAASMAARGTNVNVSIDVIKKLDTPEGYYYVKLTFYDKAKPTEVAGQQYLFTDGKYIVPDFVTVNDMGSLAKELSFELSNVNVDVKNLTPVMGKAGAKNVLVEVTDFQCAYCVQMNAYLHKKLKNNKNIVLYVMHLPLKSIHPRAEILAKIFEAGAMMGKNFVNDLYDGANGNLSEVDLIDKYAKISGNTSQFKKLVSSKEVAKKVADAEAQATALGISSTPGLFVNGKLIVGFDQQLIDKAIDGLK